MRREDVKIIANIISFLLVILGIIETIPAFFALYYNEDISAFLIPSLFLIFSGVIISHSIKVEKEISFMHAMVVAALIYPIAAIFGAMPFVKLGMLSFFDASFEAISGFTTTGLTMFSNVENLPRSILLWRSFMQWVGGIGIVVLMLTVLEVSGGATAYRFYQAEARTERIKPRIISTIKLLWWIYILYTFSAILLFYVAGMNFFDSINHTFALLSTGGFSTKNTSFASFNSVRINMIAMLIMFLGATNFYVHYKFLTGERKDAIKNIELRFMAAILFLGTFVFFLKTGDFLNSAFQVVSATTTTGASTIELAKLDDFSKSFLSLLMVFGANSGSTGGGVKSIRIVIILAALYWYIKQSILPERAVISHEINGNEISDEALHAAEFFTLLYLIILSLSSLSLMAYGYKTADAIFEVASALSNVGLSIGITSSAAPFLVKFILFVDMWFGRIEIIPFFVLIGSIFYRRKT